MYGRSRFKKITKEGKVEEEDGTGKEMKRLKGRGTEQDGGIWMASPPAVTLSPTMYQVPGKRQTS